MKVLVIQLGAAVDVLLATPLLRCIKNQLSNVELHVLVRPDLSDLIVHNPYINHLHLLHFNWKTTVETLKLVGFDHVINVKAGKEADAIAEALHIPHLPGSQKGFKTFFKKLFQHKKREHPAAQYIKSAAALGVVNDGAGMNYFIPREAEVPYTDIPAAHGAGYLVIPVRMNGEHLWPQHLLQHLVTIINHPIILIGDAADRDFAEKVKSVDNIKIYNACGKFSLHENADLIQKSKLVMAAHPFYVQTAAALQKELVWLQSEQNVPPYYSSQYLKKRTTPAFENVKIPPGIISNNNSAIAEKQVNNFLQEIEKSVNRRLRPKA